MKITFEVPDSRAGFLLELLRSLPYVTLRGQAAKTAVPDETAHLLASPANAARLRAAVARAGAANTKPTSCPRYDSELGQRRLGRLPVLAGHG